MKINYLNFRKIKKYLSMGLVLWITTTPVTAENGSHVVKRGETLGKISTMYYGNSSYYDSIAIYNNISNPDLIHTGMLIEIPTLESLLSFCEQNPNKQMSYKEKLKEESINSYGSSDYFGILAKINGIGNLNSFYDNRELHIPSFNNLLNYIDLATKILEEDVLSNYYFVEQGDTLSKISYKKYGNYDYVDFLADINVLKNKNIIHVGELLYVPGMYVENNYTLKKK